MALSNLKNLASLAQAARNPPGAVVMKLPLETVKPKPDQVRKAFEDIHGLADSLLQDGQIQPIIVSPPGPDGLYEIQKGERRWHACREAGLATIDAIVHDAAASALEATAGELVENIQRDDLKPLEIAAALQRFVEAGWKQKDIARRIGKTVPFVSSHLSLLRLPPVIAGLYEQGITRDTETLNNLRQLHELDSAACLELCNEAVAGGSGMSRLQSRTALNARKKPAGTASPGIPAQQAANKPDPAAPSAWRMVKPSQVRLGVRVSLDGESQPGLLLTDRVDPDGAHVWVRLDDQVLRVPVAQVRLEKMSAR